MALRAKKKFRSGNVQVALKLFALAWLKGHFSREERVHALIRLDQARKRLDLRDTGEVR